MLADVPIAIQSEWNKPDGGLVMGNWVVICNLVSCCCLHCGASIRAANAVTVVGLDNGDIKHDLDSVGLIVVFNVDYVCLDDCVVGSVAYGDFSVESFDWGIIITKGTLLDQIK